MCTIVEFSCLLDINSIKKFNEKLEVYAPLARNIQSVYPDYKFEIVLVVLGTMEYVLDSKVKKSNCYLQKASEIYLW